MTGDTRLPSADECVLRSTLEKWWAPHQTRYSSKSQRLRRSPVVRCKMAAATPGGFYRLGVRQGDSVAAHLGRRKPRFKGQ